MKTIEYIHPDFRTIMKAKEMTETEQILFLLANCMVDDKGNKLYAAADNVNECLKPKEIIHHFQEITKLIEQEYDFSDPLSKQVSNTQTGNGYPYSVSGKPL